MGRTFPTRLTGMGVVRGSWGGESGAPPVNLDLGSVLGVAGPGVYWIPGKLRTPLHRRSGREGSRASRGGPGRGTFRKSIGMAVYSGFLCVAPPWPSSRSWFCFEEPDPFPCPGKFVGSFSRQSRCSHRLSQCEVRESLSGQAFYKFRFSQQTWIFTPVAVFVKPAARCRSVSVYGSQERGAGCTAQEVAVAGHTRLVVRHWWPVDHRRMGACNV